ncbi:MAG: acetyltransferase [Bacteroidales bacterium]|nr:acetyltransferase [Bacteroidales bacterium]
METISLFGAGGHGRVVREVITAMGNEVDCYYDDSPRTAEKDDLKVLRLEDCRPAGKMIVSVGDNEIRRKVVERLNAEYATAIHPTAVISPSAAIAEGTVVMAGAIVQAHAKIGRHCIINTCASVDHECEVGDFVHISPHATLCGDIKVGEMSLIGAGAVVLSGVRIGKNCIVGAGGVVVRDLPDNTVVYGNHSMVTKDR